MGAERSSKAGIVLNAGALIALDRGDERVVAILKRAFAQGRVCRVPAGVIGQAWRHGRLQARLARFLRSHDLEIVPLDAKVARQCGELCALANSSDTIDASVVLLAQDTHDPP